MYKLNWGLLMKRTAFLLMIIVIISKILGLGRDIVLSYYYGVSSISDAYLIALAIPGVIFSLVGTSIQTGYIPMYSKVEKEKGFKAAEDFTNNIINILLLICTIVIFFCLLFTEEIVKVFASGFDQETINIAVNFTKITIFGIYFTAVIYIYTGRLQLSGKYSITSFIGIPLNIIFIVSIHLSVKNVFFLAFGCVVAYLAQFLLLIPSLKKTGYKYRFTLNVKNEYFINMVYISIPLIIGVSVNQINYLVSRTIASQISVGGISALNYAETLNNFVQSVFVTTILSIVYPKLSKIASNGDIQEFTDVISKALKGIALFVIPCSVGLIIFSEEIIKMLFGRGAFDSEAVNMTSNTLLYYSIGIIGIAIREVISKGFYAIQDIKTPMINSAIAMIINIFLSIFLSKFMGVGGLALANSLSALICSILLLRSYQYKISNLNNKSLINLLIKIIVCSLIMGIIAKFLFEILNIFIDTNISLIISIVFGGFLYLIIISFSGIKEVKLGIDLFKKKINR